ncbi:MAG: PhzF family phenazine biosynthesis protein [Acidobacteriota bacterium]|nr:PhzF family phenazine biosynthesis protein [Acidobacteriota bacterium]
MALSLTVVDAFTDRPFTGNPAAVALVEAFPGEERMQAVAAEMALSETAFCVGRPDGDHDLRWFTPTVEVDLCGHATLATAHVLGGAGRFHTRSGLLTCRSESETVWMDLPADPPVETPPPAGLALEGVRGSATCREDLLLELADAALVRALVPDMAAIASLGSRGVIVTAAGDRPGVDCVSRFFAPNAGIPEDPVTGSAHCALAVWWAARTGRTELVGEQASPRGGTVQMVLGGDRVRLGGRAVTVSRVEMVA